MVLIKEGNNIHNFDPATSIPDLGSKVIIVTGGNAGVGKQTVLELSRHHPKKLYMTARSQAKYDAAMQDILAANPTAKVDLLELDLGSVDSVKRAAAAFLAKENRLDILINNAGILGMSSLSQSTLKPTSHLSHTHTDTDTHNPQARPPV